MSDRDRELWEQLSDREAAGEVLSPEEQSRRKQLEARFEECAREAAFYRTLSSVLEQASSEAPGDDRLIRAALGDAGTPVEASPSVRSGRRRWAFVALFAAALSLLGYPAWQLVHRDSRAQVASGGPGAGPGPVRIAWTSGKVRLNGKEVVPGAALEIGSVVETLAGEACVAFDRGIVACAAEDSKLCVTALGKSQQLELSAGRITAMLDHQPSGTRFVVSTRAGAVAAVGTIFGVEVESGGGAVVRVEEGAVAAQTPGLELLVRQGRLLRLGAENTEPLPAAAFERDSALLASRVSGSADVARRLGAARASLSAAPEPAVRVVETPGETRKAAALARTPQKATAAELLRQASDARSRAAYAEAARHYERLIQAYPGSAEGKAALVALAEVRLSKLGQASGALTLYETYLSSGGSLAREAHYGKIHALRAMGRFADERREIDAFLARYPNSAYASSMRKRLQSL